MNPSSIKAKGRRAENEVANYLASRLHRIVERRRLTGVRDRGDIAGIPGLVVEVKSGARLDLPGWLAELEVEVVNDGADAGVLVVRPRGVTDPGRFYAVMPLERWVTMWERSAG